MLSMLKLCSTFECYTAMEYPTNRLYFPGVHTSLYHSIENTAANTILSVRCLTYTRAFLYSYWLLFLYGMLSKLECMRVHHRPMMGSHDV